MKPTAFFLFAYTACVILLTWHYTSTYNSIYKPILATDAEIEAALFEQYGQRLDFMGNPVDADYFVNITDTGTQIYTMQGKFVDFIPFDSTSQFDRAILADNL